MKKYWIGKVLLEIKYENVICGLIEVKIFIIYDI